MDRFLERLPTPDGLGGTPPRNTDLRRFLEEEEMVDGVGEIMAEPRDGGLIWLG